MELAGAVQAVHSKRWKTLQAVSESQQQQQAAQMEEHSL